MDEKGPSLESLADLYEQALAPIFVGSKISINSTFVVISICTMHGVSNAFADVLLCYQSSLFLPTINALPSKFYDAKSMVRKLDVSYNIIHCCLDGCVLSRRELQKHETCPKCGKNRYQEGSKIVPNKVIRHFHFISQLKCLCGSPRIAKLLRWHYEQVASGGDSDRTKIEFVVDSPTWKHIEKIDPSFLEDCRNIRMDLSLDGINPLFVKSIGHSTWPSVLIMYNFLPRLVTKKFFLILSILISGKESLNDKNIDVFLEPLLEELLKLWDGVLVSNIPKDYLNKDLHWIKCQGLMEQT